MGPSTLAAPVAISNRFTFIEPKKITQAIYSSDERRQFSHRSFMGSTNILLKKPYPIHNSHATGGFKGIHIIVGRSVPPLAPHQATGIPVFPCFFRIVI